MSEPLIFTLMHNNYFRLSSIDAFPLASITRLIRLIYLSKNCRLAAGVISMRVAFNAASSMSLTFNFNASSR